MEREREEGQLGVVILTHGDVGSELLKVASYIMGEKLNRVRTVRVPFAGEETMARFSASLSPYQERQRVIADELAVAIAEVDTQAGVLILTDTYGGSAFAIARRYIETGNLAALVSGVNLPMMLKIPAIRHLPLGKAATELADRSQAAIVRWPPA